MQFNKKLIIKLFFSNFIIFIFLYLILEIFTGNLLFKKKLDCAYLLCNKTYNFLTPFEFYEKNEKIIYHRDEYGFRGRRKDINNIDVLVIGGSTTDERFLKLDDTWTEKLEKLFLNRGLDIDIVNSGVDGQSTIGHIWNFDNWFKKLKNFRTKYIIFYIGINERLDLITYDNYLPSNLSLFNNLKYWVKKNNGITYKLLSYIYINYFIDNTYIVSKGVSHGDRKPNYKQIDLLNELNEEYVKHVNTNINKLYDLSLEFNSIPIFITQKTLLGKYEEGKYYTINDKNMYLFEKNIANEIMKFCYLKKIVCLNLNDDVLFNIEDMYDLIHTTPKGSEKIANYIYQNLKNYLNLN